MLTLDLSAQGRLLMTRDLCQGLVPRLVERRTARTSERRHGNALHTQRRVDWLKHGIAIHFPLTGVQGFGSISDPPFSQVSYAVLPFEVFCLSFISFASPFSAFRLLAPLSPEDLLKYPLVSLSLVSPGFCPLLEPAPDTSS